MIDNKISIFKQYDETIKSEITLKNSPATVKIVENYPLDGEKPRCKEVAVAVIEKEHNFRWVEGITGPKEFMNQYIKPGVNNTIKQLQSNREYKDAKKAYHDSRNNPYQKDYALYKVNDEIGYGLMYVGEKPIPVDTAVNFYAGALCEAMVHGTDAYSVGGKKSELFMPTAGDKPTSCINAREAGNITRFINCLPNDFEIEEEFEFATGISSKDIATANLMGSVMELDELPLVIFVANRVIQCGDILGYSYGQDYWHHQALKNDNHVKQLLFKPDGSIIPSYMYRLKTISIPSNNIEKRFGLCLANSLRHAMGNNRILEIRNSSGQITDTVTIDEARTALTNNNYVASMPLQKFSELQQPTTDCLNLEILKKNVHFRFCAYRHEKDHKEEIIHAAIKYATENEKLKILAILANSGVFPLFLDQHIIIEGINQPHVFEAVKRIKATPSAVLLKPLGEQIGQWIYQEKTLIPKCKDFYDALLNETYSVALRTACFDENKERGFALAKILLEFNDPKLEIKIDEVPNSSGKAAIHRAIEKENWKLVGLLVAHGADTALCSKQKQTADQCKDKWEGYCDEFKSMGIKWF